MLINILYGTGAVTADSAQNSSTTLETASTTHASIILNLTRYEYFKTINLQLCNQLKF